MNERIRDVNEAFGLGPSSYELVCECAHCDCMQRLQIPGDVYEKVRLTADRYLVAAGHERAWSEALRRIADEDGSPPDR